MMTSRPLKTVPDRVRFAVELLDPGPADRILEIGCGPGVAAALVCERLSTGRLLAVDRSAVAVQRTAERNADHVRSGRLEVRAATLEGLELPEGSLDAAFSVNVNLFWTRSPAHELSLLSGWLRAGGALHVCYDAGGPQSPSRVTTPIADALSRHGFVDVGIHADDRGLAVSGRTPG
jgi:SAM-dependent methyltransferase